MRSSMQQGSETWPVRKENEVALPRAEMRMVRLRWMCNVKIKDRVSSKELRERLGIDDRILILQQNTLRWYGHELRKEDTDWVKKCMKWKWRAPDQEVDEEVDHIGHGKRLCKKIARHAI